MIIQDQTAPGTCLQDRIRRRNPEKGIKIDPQWEPISWEEALETVVEKLKKIKAEDPRKLLGCMFDAHVYTQFFSWMAAFGSPTILVTLKTRPATSLNYWLKTHGFRCTQNWVQNQAFIICGTKNYRGNYLVNRFGSTLQTS